MNNNKGVCGGILERYKAQKAIDDVNEQNEEIKAPEDMTPMEQQEYCKEVMRLREAMSKAAHPQFINKKESELQTVDAPIKEIKLRRAFCPECGEELKAIGPVMYEGMTGKKMCVHKCSKCGTVFNLDFSYPRLVVTDEDGNEVFAYNAV